MKSLADGLPAEIARQIDPNWRKNDTVYKLSGTNCLASTKASGSALPTAS